MMPYEIVPDNLEVVELGAYLGSHSTVSQWAQAATPQGTPCSDGSDR